MGLVAAALVAQTERVRIELLGTGAGAVEQRADRAAPGPDRARRG
ncbi:MAG: hypothetical protein ACRDRU_19545 [Pseudonocardiaceae bacterium]